MGPSHIIVQLIQTTWDKSARGGAEATLRNQIQHALHLPDLTDLERDPGLIVHLSHWGQENHFEAPLTSKLSVTDKSAEFKYGCVTIKDGDNAVELAWIWNETAGVPSAESRKPLKASLLHSLAKDDGWIRLRWNGRLTDRDTGQWWYESVILNVGVSLKTKVQSDFFLKSDPAQDLSRMAHLR